MSRFNQPKATTKITNLAGGQAYSQSPELELVSILLTSFANDQFYKKSDDTFARLISLIIDCDKEFVAKAAVYARTEFGMRSITHVVASELAQHIGGTSWAKDFYHAVIHRPDDMMEILSYHFSKNGKVTNAIRKGFAKAFEKFSKYQLAKYRGESKGVKLVDVVNIVHPTPVEKNAEAINALVKGELKSFDTWESELSKAGNAEDKDEFKKEVWTRLIQEKKLGYFALLRNLRNIIEQAPDVLPLALEQLTDEKLIESSLVLPFRYMTALEEIAKLNSGKMTRDVIVAIGKAVDISVKNVPRFEGETLIALDESGSMTYNDAKPARIGALFAAVLAKSSNADLLTFSDNARMRQYNPNDSVTTIASQIKFSSGGTNFHSIFQTINRKYDRIIILSDMQGWVGGHTPVHEFNVYKNKYNANPVIYSFDLQGYGSMQFPENNVYCVAGFSEKVFEIMHLLEKDRNALINEIKKVQF